MALSITHMKGGIPMEVEKELAGRVLVGEEQAKALQMIADLRKAGCKFTSGIFSFTVSKENKEIGDNLPVMITALLKAQPGSVVGPVRTKFFGIIQQAHQEFFSASFKIPVEEPGPSPGDVPAAQQVSLKPKTKAAPTSQVVPLAQAKALLQPTHGTSPGSVYRAVAIGKGINVSARLKTGTLSIRLEGPKLMTLGPKLVDLGITLNSGYASAHIPLGALSASKVLGAYLMELNTGTEAHFTDIISMVMEDQIK